MPELTRVLVEAQPAGGAGMLDRTREHAHKAGTGERVAGSAFVQQPGAPAADEQKPIRQPVGKLDGGQVVAQLAGGDVADKGDVRVAGAGGRGAREQLQRPTVPCRGRFTFILPPNMARCWVAALVSQYLYALDTQRQLLWAAPFPLGPGARK